MKRAFIIVFAVLVAVAAGALFWKRDRRPEAKLSDGSKVLLAEAFVGEHRNPNLVEKPWTKLLRQLPPRFQQFFPNLARTGNSAGRSWHHVPVDTNSLHVWLERWDAINSQSGQQFEEYPIVITDRDGWAWFNNGLAEMRPTGTNRVDHAGYSFAGFPRWEEFLELQLFHSQWIGGQRAFNKLGALRVRNPAHVSPPAQWPTKRLPQTMTFNDVQVTLSALEFRRNWQGRELPPDAGTATALVNLKMSVEEQLNGELLTGAWHEVTKSFFDNYGNNSHNGLPPRRVADTNAPPMQWRIAIDLVGDHRSQVASNHFLLLSPKTLPAAGERAQVEPITLELDGAKFGVAGLLGPGQAKYTNGVFETNFVPAELPNYLQESIGSSDNFGGKRLSTVSLGSGDPHIAFSYEGKLDQTWWFTLRATDEETGQSLWLERRGKASSKPSFAKVYNNPQLVWFSCEGLNTNRTWQFTFGVHRPRRVEFIIDRPEWDGKLR